MVRGDRELDNRHPLVKDLEPAPLDTQALNGDQSLSTWKRILHQIACRVTDFVDFLLGEDVQVMVGARFPQHLTYATGPAPDRGTVPPALGIRDAGSNFVCTRRRGRKGTGAWRSLRDQRTR